MSEKKLKLNHESLLLIIGSFLIIIAFILYNYELIMEVNNELKSEIQSKIFKEINRNTDINVNINVNYLDSEDKNEIIIDNQNDINYIAFLEIDKINLKQGILPKNNYYNNVDYHVQILDVSDYPDTLGGNFILAAHSGNSSIAYFKNLYKLSVGDYAKVFYKNKVYRYSVVNIYLEEKDGSIAIYRDIDKTSLTLITCTKNDEKHQTVYIFELVGVETF